MNSLMVLAHAKSTMVMQNVKGFLKEQKGEFNDGGSSNWGRNTAIGFAIAFILFGLMKAFMPDLFNAFTTKILTFFN